MKVAEMCNCVSVKGTRQAFQRNFAPDNFGIVGLGETVSRDNGATRHNGAGVQKFPAADFADAEQRQVRESFYVLQQLQILLDRKVRGVALLVVGNIDTQVKHEPDDCQINDQHGGMDESGMMPGGTDFQGKIKRS